MSLLPAKKVILDKNLTDDEALDVARQIKATSGVISVFFNQEAKTAVTTYSGGQKTLAEIKKIKGVVSFKNQY